MRTSVLAVGEALVDVVDDGTTTREHPGGSSYNVAVGLARLGTPVELATSVGPDARGRLLREHLAAAGVRVTAGSARATPTSTSVARLRPDGSAEYDFDVEWTFTPPPAAELPALVHTGSLGAFVEPGGAAVEALADALPARCLLTFDPNVRPALMGGRAAALRRVGALARRAVLVKTSDEDAAWLFPGRTPEEVVAALLEEGPAVVVVTRGAAGALLASRAATVAVPPHAVDVVDTVGAGDSFTAALLAGLADLLDAGRTPDELRAGHLFTAERLTAMGIIAARCAALTCSRPGADPPTRADLDDLAAPPTPTTTSAATPTPGSPS